MKNVNWNDVEEVRDESPTPDGYVCRICDIEDNEAKEYLKIYFDIAEGDFASHYSDKAMRFERWPAAATFVKSYKQKALPFFKGFITALEQSNPGFKWTEKVNLNPGLAKGLYLGIVLGEKEYEYNGEIRTRLDARRITSVDNIRSGNFTVPDCKRLAPKEAPIQAIDMDDGELPF